MTPQRKSWDAEEDDQLRFLYKQLAPERRLGDIPKILGRSHSSIQHRASRLGITNPFNPRPNGKNAWRWNGGRRASELRFLAKQAEERRTRGARQQVPWTAEEEAVLRELALVASYKEIASKLGKTVRAVASKMRREGIKGRGQAWQSPGEGHHNWKGGKTASLRRSKYQLEPDQFNALLASQGGVCAICKRDGTHHKKGWATDHDHGTDLVRGILCSFCNLILGHAKDSTEVLQAAIDYLQSHQAKQLASTNSAISLPGVGDHVF